MARYCRNHLIENDKVLKHLEMDALVPFIFVYSSLLDYFDELRQVMLYDLLTTSLLSMQPQSHSHPPVASS